MCAILCDAKSCVYQDVVRVGDTCCDDDIPPLPRLDKEFLVFSVSIKTRASKETDLASLMYKELFLARYEPRSHHNVEFQF